jgi:hypothetical protein
MIHCRRSVSMIQITISLRALVFVLLLTVVTLTSSDVAKGAPLLADLPVDGNVVFTASGQDGVRDIHTTGNNGGMRFYNANSLAPIPDGAAIQFFGNGSTGFPGQAFIDSGAHNNAAVIFRTAATNGPITERMRVTSDGKVGIGTTAPSQTLTVAGNSLITGSLKVETGDSFDEALYVESSPTVHRRGGIIQHQDTLYGWRQAVTDTGGPGFLYFDYVNRLDPATVVAPDVLVLNSDGAGRVAIGTSSMSDKLRVLGDIRIGTTGNNGCIKEADGDILVGTCPSDLALKKDIAPLSPVLARLASLKPVSFAWRADEFPDMHLGSGSDLGLIAQEVEQVFPEMVVQDEHGLKSVRYHHLPLLLLQGIGELQDENDSLREELAAQQSAHQTEMADLQSRLEAIEQRLTGGTVPLVATR